MSWIKKENTNPPKNHTKLQSKIDILKSRLALIKQGGKESARKSHQKRGKILVRERINLLCDHEKPFLELSTLAGFELYEDDLPAAGIITGIGQVCGTYCMIIANDATVKGGSYFPITAKKHLRAQQIAMQNHLPCIYLVDSGGAFLPKQSEVFPDKEHFGRIFYNQAHMSAQNIAQIAVVMGSCTAGGAYVPAMSDETIMVKNQATIFLAGPPLVKAATGEVVTAEQLGGADTHCRKSGVADYYAEDDQDAIRMARHCIKNINKQNLCYVVTQPAHAPRHDIQDIDSIIPDDPRLPFDIREIISRLVDRSEFDEFKALYGKTLVCGFCHIDGYPVGIVANNGILFGESAQKGTHFISLCSQRKIPLLFLQNISGFMVGQHYEEQGIAKHGAKMVHAVACSQVPKITIIIGGSYGAGNYAMCGRAYDPDFLFCWPNANIAVMGGEQAAQVMTQIKLAKLKSQNQSWPKDKLLEYQLNLTEKYNKEADCFYGSARLWDDGIITPCETRQVVSQCLDICCHRKIKNTEHGVFRF